MMVAPYSSTKSKASGLFKYQRPPLYKKQEAAIFAPERISLCEASTKSGKTVACIAWLFEQAYLGKAGQNFWWVAPVYNQAKIAFTRMILAIPKPVLAHVHNGNMVIKLMNGATLSFKSGEKPDALYGEDVYAAVIDEASRLREESWYAVRSTLTATQGPVRLIGNVKGRKNFFYALCRRAEAGASPSMSYHRMISADAVEAGILSAEEIEEARMVLPAAVFKELYLAEPSDDQGNPFGIQDIAKCVQPLAATEPICWGWDLAKKQDWTVGIALDANGSICRFERFQCPWPETIRRIRIATGPAPALVDSTGVGDPVLDHLQLEAGTNFEGYFYSQPSKQKLMEGLAVGIQSHRTSVLEGVHRLELEAFEYEFSRNSVHYRAPEGMHDDTVCAHAQAYHHFTMNNNLSTWVKMGQD